MTPIADRVTLGMADRVFGCRYRREVSPAVESDAECVHSRTVAKYRAPAVLRLESRDSESGLS